MYCRGYKQKEEYPTHKDREAVESLEGTEGREDSGKGEKEKWRGTARSKKGKEIQA